MADVFISYSRKDKDFVRDLHEALAARERDTWVDWEDIPLTAEWLAEIYAGIEGADAFVFVISPDSQRVAWPLSLCKTRCMKPYSKDLRLKVLAAVDRGMPRAEAAKVFGVSLPSIERYLKMRRETGDVEPKPPPGLGPVRARRWRRRCPLRCGPTPTSRSKSTASSSRRPRGCGSRPPR